MEKKPLRAPGATEDIASSVPHTYDDAVSYSPVSARDRTGDSASVPYDLQQSLVWDRDELGGDVYGGIHRSVCCLE